MNTSAHHILGNDALYNRLCLATEVLGKLVACAPKAVGTEELTAATRGTPREVLKLCRILCEDGLLVREPGRRAGWRLACDPSTVTLEDAFRCLMTQQPAHPARAHAAGEENTVESEVDVLVMQATMSINQSVLQLLRRFSLDRLRVAMLGPSLGLPMTQDAAWRFSRLGFS